MIRNSNFPKLLLKIILFIIIFAPLSEAAAQGCPDDILTNGKYFLKEVRFQDALATFKSVILLFPASAAAEESHYLTIVAYRTLAFRQKTAIWLSRARESIRQYKNRYPDGKFKEEVEIEVNRVESIEAQLTGVSKGMFITLTGIAIGSVLVLGLAVGL